MESFLKAWEASNYYAVIFQPKSDDDVTRSRQAFEEPARLAVAFSPKAVFISKILYARHEQKNADGIGHHVIGVPIKRALDILSKVGPKKFTVDLQSQLCNIVQEQANSYDSRLFSFAARRKARMNRPLRGCFDRALTRSWVLLAANSFREKIQRSACSICSPMSYWASKA